MWFIKSKKKDLIPISQRQDKTFFSVTLVLLGTEILNQNTYQKDAFNTEESFRNHYKKNDISLSDSYTEEQ